METEKQLVLDLVQKMNKCWTEGDPCLVDNYFHEKMVAMNPSQSGRILGKEACVNGWVGFNKSTSIKSWKEIDPLVEIFNSDTAIVTYNFEILYDMNGISYDIKGKDMFTLIKENGKWWIVANHFSMN
ncbi:MAG: nuclear transport factor 2 family protein [Bacteroidota bacterium]|nr:nuclear transport factor 2 family protein [Bacteroidota bacterium]MDP4192633.1 nuclear transport factor 2 family protein [Bacteroidota bacterium]MDP4196091.1 nuclear transport factor 2 family protein [Bacteroidota bacterium]